MKTRSASVAVLAAVAIVVALVGEVGASGNPPGYLAPCQTAHPSGAPIKMTFIATGVHPETNAVDSVTVIPAFAGKTYGPITVTPGDLDALATIGNQMDAGCAIFNGTTLATQILAAIGMGGSQINLTACSFLGGAAEECTLKAPLGGVHTPLGWAGGAVTGYIGR